MSFNSSRAFHATLTINNETQSIACVESLLEPENVWILVSRVRAAHLDSGRGGRRQRGTVVPDAAGQRDPRAYTTSYSAKM
jgi:hypothetical protein